MCVCVCVCACGRAYPALCTISRPPVGSVSGTKRSDPDFESNKGERVLIQARRQPTLVSCTGTEIPNSEQTHSTRWPQIHLELVKLAKMNVFPSSVKKSLKTSIIGKLLPNGCHFAPNLGSDSVCESFPSTTRGGMF